MRTDKYPKITDVTQMDDSDSEADEDTNEHNSTGEDDKVQKRAVGRHGMERLAVCEDCNLAFCTVCLASWHGDFVRCEPRDLNQLTEEDQASLNFILKSTSPCPYCSVPCQKSYGCNRKSHLTRIHSSQRLVLTTLIRYDMCSVRDTFLLPLRRLA
jgi:E3 ubiquitin-protein ligase RNF14